MDPITGENEKKPVKPFMVNQLTISFERDRIMMSPFDEVLPKQLGDYEVVRINQSGQPVYSDKDEHFCDAIALAHLAFVLEFKNITDTIKDFEVASKINVTSKSVSRASASRMHNSIKSSYASKRVNGPSLKDDDDLDRPTAIRVPLSSMRSNSRRSWGNRNSYGGARSMW